MIYSGPFCLLKHQFFSNYYFSDVAVAGIHCILRRFGLAYISIIVGRPNQGQLGLVLAIEAWTSTQLRFHFGTATAIIMSTCLLYSGELSRFLAFGLHKRGGVRGECFGECLVRVLHLSIALHTRRFMLACIRGNWYPVLRLCLGTDAFYGRLQIRCGQGPPRPPGVVGSGNTQFQVALS